MPRTWRVGLAIAGAIVLALVLSPLGYVLATMAGDPGAALRAAGRADVWGLTARSLALAVCVTVSALGLATLLAWIIGATDLPGGRRWLAPLALPLAAPSFLVAEAYRSALGVDGFAGAWQAMTLITYPYALIPLEAALRRRCRDAEFAARSLGLGAWTSFRRATLPQLLPTLEWTGLLVALYALALLVMANASASSSAAGCQPENTVAGSASGPASGYHSVRWRWFSALAASATRSAWATRSLLRST